MARGDAFTRDQRVRLERGVQAYITQTGMQLSLMIGPLGDTPRRTAERWLANIVDGHPDAVLMAVDPGERRVEILTSAHASQRLSDQACGLAVLGMTRSFGVGDLVGGIINGLRMLSDAAGRGPAGSAAKRRELTQIAEPPLESAH